MKKTISQLLALAVLAFAACQSDTAKKPDEKTDEKATGLVKPADGSADQTSPAVLPGPSQAPEKFLVNLNEKGEIKVMGEPVKFEEFQTTVARYLLSYKMGGATKMPPLEIVSDGTTGMGARAELRTFYDEAVKKIEASK